MLCMLDAELGQFMEDTGSPQKRLIGHSGPVYGTSFSHDNRFLLSCSEDCTGTDGLEWAFSVHHTHTTHTRARTQSHKH